MAEHDLAIAMASTNTEAILGVPHERLLGACLGDIFGAASERELRDRLGDLTDPISLSTERGRFEATLHRASNLLVIELEPAGRDPQQRIFEVVDRMHFALTTVELVTIVAAELRALTGFDRVTLVRGDGAYETIADARGEGIAANPHVDTVHQLFPHETSRYLADRAAAAVPVVQAASLTPIDLDLSRATLRVTAAEPASGATLSLRIVVGDKPWGLVACEHEGPLAVSLKTRIAAQRIVTVLGHQLHLRDRLGAESRASSLAKDELLALVSHELRTPLNAMLGWLRLIEAGHVAPDGLRTAITTITRNATALGELVEELLDLSRIVTGKMRLDLQPVQPAAIVEAALATVQPTAEAKSIRIHTALDPAAGPVLADANRLQQVLGNLLANAIKFTEEHGKVTAKLARRGSAVEIVISDTGVGIDPGFLPYVFDRFRQAPNPSDRTKRGLGLGLSIVRHLVEQHGGTVAASSAGIGKGATFTVQLPLAEVRAHSTPFERVATFQPAPELRGLRVLAVDDERDATELLQAVLSASGVDVTTATTAAEVLELLPRIRPHVLISDIGMPDVDGYELIQRVRKLPPSEGGRTPAIAVTAFARTQDRSRAFLAGFDLYLAKPLDPAELTAVLVNLASRESATAALAPETDKSKLRLLAGARVLVIDDDRDAAELLALILERHGATVCSAYSAAEGAERVRSFRPDVLVSDISLPDQDGYTFMRELRARGPDEGGWIPAIAISGHVAPDDVKQAILAGFQLHVAKPIDPQDLIARLARLVARTSRRT